MPISANTLFHFTKDLKTMFSILETKFYPRLCLEQSVFPQLDLRLAVPMVCFCDIPLSQINDHTRKYGKYAIGIKKDWAIQQGVSPVLYVHENSLIPRTIFNEMQELSKKGVSAIGSSDSLKLMRYVDAVCMMKPYEGLDDTTKKTIRFYDEREWRYVPPREKEDHLGYLIEDLFNNEDLRKRVNTVNEKYGVVFNPDVINYLIVADDNDILELKHRLETIKAGFPFHSVELLMTRILSMERIQEDM